MRKQNKGATKVTPKLKIPSKEILTNKEYHKGSMFGIFAEIVKLREEMELIYSNPNEISQREIQRQGLNYF